VSLALILLGGACLYLGGELLVRHASALARGLGVSSLVIGLSVVALGTSAPELATTLSAAFARQPAVALGNVVGSNITNIGLILGIAALVKPLAATRSFIRL